jgi:imidazolonepropionase-like amidohydrolase
MRNLLVIWLASSLTIAASPAAAPFARDRAIAIKGGTVITVTGPSIAGGVVVFAGGKIVDVGASVPIPAGAEVFDATGKYVMPGIVDAMTMIGMDSAELNEPSDSMTPQLRIIESFNPFGHVGEGPPGPIRMSEPLSGGVTAMYIAPGDASVMGGQGAVVKTAGSNLAAMAVREPAAIEMSLGEEPKKAAKGRGPATRMAELAMIRQMLVKAQEYQRSLAESRPGPRDLGMEALAKLLRHEIPARIGANSALDIRSAIALSAEFSFDLVVEGGAAAYQYQTELARRQIPLVLAQVTHPYTSGDVAPDSAGYPPRDERRPAKLTEAGVKIAIASFSRAFGAVAPAGTSKWLLIDAAVAGGYGMKGDDILRSVTINAAEILGISDRVGSITVGKDADIIVLDGPPLSIKTWVQRVYVDGELVHVRKANSRLGPS